MKWTLRLLVCLTLTLFVGSPAFADERATLYFFYSPTCPHCHKEAAFLDGLEERYPELRVERRVSAQEDNVPLMRELASRHGVEEYLGSVPLTFVGEYHFLGYRSDETTGREIERAVVATLAGAAGVATSSAPATQRATDGAAPVPAGERSPTLTVPLLGEVEVGAYPFVLLAALLGFFDGFNVCSLGALTLILALVLTLKRRGVIALMGGTFLIVTALAYGVLIVLWHALFSVLGAFVPYLTLLVGVLALGGAVYFGKEYVRMLREGPVCALPNIPLLTRITRDTQEAFSARTSLVTLIGVTALFALVVTVVEFPCSAAVPLVFAGVLADAGVSQLAAYGYIATFVLFYLLDELMLFLLVLWRLRFVGASPRVARGAVLAEGLILAALGLWYLGSALFV